MLQKVFLIQFFEIMYSTTFVIILNSSFYIQKVDGVNWLIIALHPSGIISAI
jgi:hypothetical protein